MKYSVENDVLHVKYNLCFCLQNTLDELLLTSQVHQLSPWLLNTGSSRHHRPANHQGGSVWMGLSRSEFATAYFLAPDALLPWSHLMHDLHKTGIP